jgi:hypothetical protein
VLELDGPRKRLREPTAHFVDHTLAIGRLVVALTVEAQKGVCELLEIEAEPSCWRPFPSVGGRQVLRPDLFVSLGVGAYERRWFVEIDRGSESLPVLMRKCRIYDAYYRSGAEQAQHGVFPRACWVVPDQRRAARLQKAIESTRQLSEQLFTVAIDETAVDLLIGAES